MVFALVIYMPKPHSGECRLVEGEGILLKNKQLVVNPKRKTFLYLFFKP
jgi:hypothetical protein